MWHVKRSMSQEIESPHTAPPLQSSLSSAEINPPKNCLHGTKLWHVEKETMNLPDSDDIRTSTGRLWKVACASSFLEPPP